MHGYVQRAAERVVASPVFARSLPANDRREEFAYLGPDRAWGLQKYTRFGDGRDVVAEGSGGVQSRG